MAATPTTSADGWPVVLVLLALHEEMRCCTIRHIDALLERLDLATDRAIAGIRADGRRLGIDPVRIERDVDAFERRHAGAREWFTTRRNAVLAGLPDLPEPPQV